MVLQVSRAVLVTVQINFGKKVWLSSIFSSACIRSVIGYGRTVRPRCDCRLSRLESVTSGKWSVVTGHSLLLVLSTPQSPFGRRQHETTNCSHGATGDEERVDTLFDVAFILDKAIALSIAP
jgi:hypothetical protein